MTTTTDFDIFDVPTARCPRCRAAMDMAAQADGGNDLSQSSKPPEPGDLTVCLECGTAMIFTETMHLRAVTDDDMAQLSKTARTSLLRAQEQVRAFYRAHPRPH